MIVMDVETLSSGMRSKSSRMSSMESIATPTLPTSPCAIGSSESYPICRQVERHRQSGGPGREQLVVARVGLGGGAEAGVLSHGPGARRVHGRVHTAGVRERSRGAEALGQAGREVGLVVDRLDRETRLS